jgi:hypothetical protein
MPLPNGLYKIAFETPHGTDYGVLDLREGRLRGGDSGMAYVGSYRQQGDTFVADLLTTQHRHVPGVVTALGYNDLRVQLEGVVKDGVCLAHGSSRDAKGVRFMARLTMIAD